MNAAAILAEKAIEGVISIAEDQTLADLVGLLAEKRIGAVVVTNARGALAGVISERDVIRALAESGPESLGAAVAAHMTREVVTAAPEDPLNLLLERMTTGRFRHMPVVQDGEVVGVLSIGDIVKHRIEALQRDNAALEEFIRS